MQMMGTGQITGVTKARQLVRESFRTKTYQPQSLKSGKNPLNASTRWNWRVRAQALRNNEQLRCIQLFDTPLLFEPEHVMSTDSLAERKTEIRTAAHAAKRHKKTKIP